MLATATASPARMLANQANAARSTGPRTPEGKERSRRNGFKHGLTGQGIVVADQDAPEVDRRAAALLAELDPRSTLGKALVGQIATLSVRLERSAKQEEEAVAKRTRHAAELFDHDRVDEAEDLFDGIADDPRWTLRILKRSPEGVDRLIEAWARLRDVLTRSPKGGIWPDADHAMLAYLSGLRPEQAIGTRLIQLSECIRSGETLPDPEWVALEYLARRGWARARLVEQIDEEIATLKSHRETFDLERIERDRRGAVAVTPFDTSRGACLARRYESEMRRGFFKTLEKFRQAEAEAEVKAADQAESQPEPQQQPQPAPKVAPLGSSCAAKAATPRQPAPTAPVGFPWSPGPDNGAARGLDGRVITVGRAVVAPG